MNTEIMKVKGYKFEVTSTQATQHHQYKIGERVALLKKHYDERKVHDGVIVAFYPFNNLPSIHVCYIEGGYGAAKLEFAVINEENKDVELAPAPQGTFYVDKETVLKTLERERLLKVKEIEELDAKRDYFIAHFERFFDPKEKSDD